MPAQRRQGNVVLIAMISLAAVFSLTRLYAPPVAPSGADASAALAPLRAEVARLQQQKELTQLEIAEETLRHSSAQLVPPPPSSPLPLSATDVASSPPPSRAATSEAR